MALPTFRSSSTSGHSFSNTLSVPKPSGAQEGDLLFAVHACQDGVTPAGWTYMDRFVDFDNVGIHLYRKVVGASEPSSYTFEQSTAAGVGALAAVIAYETPDPTDPIDGFISGRSPDMASSDQSPAVTTSNPNETVFVATATPWDASSVAHSTPSGTTSRAYHVGGTGGSGYHAIRIADFEQVSAGSTGSKDWGTEYSYQSSITVALVPRSSQTPNSPSLASPVAGAVVSTDETTRFEWGFSDPDPSDSQSAFDLRHRPIGGSWTTVSGGADEFLDVAAGTFADGTTYEWQVRTTDSFGQTGPYSSSETFEAVAPPAAPSITDPAGSVNSDPYTVKWSTAETQAAYQVRTVADNAGSPDTGTIYYDSGSVSSSSKSHSTSFDTNGRTEHVQVRIKGSEGLWSDWASQEVSVAYTRPATPSLSITADSPVEGAMRILQSHPAPSGGQPTVTSTDLYRREAAEGGAGIRIRANLSPSAVIDLYTSRSGVAYEFQLVAQGDNGTTEVSAWTA